MQQTATNFVPHLLSDERKQNQNHVRVCQDINEKPQKDSPFLSSIIWGDETSGLEVQQWNKVRAISMEESIMSMLEEDQTICPFVKCTLLISFKMHINVHHERISQAQTANQYFSANVLQCLWEHGLWKQPDKWCIADWDLCHYNASVHPALYMKECLTNNCVTVALYPPYSPHLAPCNFFLLWNTDLALKDRRFYSISMIQEKLQTILPVMNKKMLAVLPMVTQLLDSLYPKAMGVLQMGQHGLQRKCCYHWE